MTRTMVVPVTDTMGEPVTGTDGMVVTSVIVNTLPDFTEMSEEMPAPETIAMANLFSLETGIPYLLFIIIGVAVCLFCSIVILGMVFVRSRRRRGGRRRINRQRSKTRIGEYDRVLDQEMRKQTRAEPVAAANGKKGGDDKKSGGDVKKSGGAEKPLPKAPSDRRPLPELKPGDEQKRDLPPLKKPVADDLVSARDSPVQVRRKTVITQPVNPSTPSAPPADDDDDDVVVVVAPKAAPAAAKQEARRKQLSHSPSIRRARPFKARRCRIVARRWSHNQSIQRRRQMRRPSARRCWRDANLAAAHRRAMASPRRRRRNRARRSARRAKCAAPPRRLPRSPSRCCMSTWIRARRCAIPRRHNIWWWMILTICRPHRARPREGPAASVCRAAQDACRLANFGTET
jgi:hypothetical protein